MKNILKSIAVISLTAFVAAGCMKEVLPQGSTKTGGNFAMATFDALRRTYGYITPDLWRETAVLRSPYHQFSKKLEESEKKSL